MGNSILLEIPIYGNSPIFFPRYLTQKKAEERALHFCGRAFFAHTLSDCHIHKLAMLN